MGESVSAAGTRRSIRDEHRQLTRRPLQDAALEVFRERGYNQSSVEDIDTRAGVVRATLYLHSRTSSNCSSPSPRPAMKPPSSRAWMSFWPNGVRACPARPMRLVLAGVEDPRRTRCGQHPDEGSSSCPNRGRRTRSSRAAVRSRCTWP